MKAWFGRHKYLVVGLFVVMAILFRTYNFEAGMLFAHDQDLYSWIAKDIVGGHQRLVGQLTSVEGVFIGSFYYYLMAIFYKIFSMNPLSAVVPLTAIGIFDCWSIYFVFRRHFGKKVGLIGCILWTVSWGVASFERWSVPTEPTLTWSIWFMAVILELYKGNLKYLWLYGFLAGFTWQLHIALLPILPIPILAYIIGKNKFNLIWSKSSIMGIVVFLLTISPFILFEVKHNFSQVKAMVSGISKDQGGPRGIMKFDKIIKASGKEFQVRTVEGWENINPYGYWVILIFMMSGLSIYKKVDFKISLLFGTWFFMILLSQFVSKRIVSEYYFSNLIPIVYLYIALVLALLGEKLLIVILGSYFLLNTNWLYKRSVQDLSLIDKESIVSVIQSDVIENKYNCVAINYIADPGAGVGFRYLLWYRNINLVKPGTKDVPVYNISIPWQTVEKESPLHYGRVGVLIPAKANGISVADCQKKEYMIDPLLGYTE